MQVLKQIAQICFEQIATISDNYQKS
jgi:hypothetical protein